MHSALSLGEAVSRCSEIWDDLKGHWSEKWRVRNRDEKERVIELFWQMKRKQVTEKIFKSIHVRCKEEAGYFPFPLLKMP